MKGLSIFWKSQLSTRLTLVDQIIVSGSNFLAGILLTRFVGLDAYGVFALAWMGVLLASSLQLNFVLKPMMSLGPKKEEETQYAYYAGTHVLNIAFVLLALLVAGTLVYSADMWFPEWQIGGLFPILPIAIFAFLLQEYYRRLYFVQGKAFWALIMDVVAYGGMIGGILVSQYLGVLTVVLTYEIVAMSFCASFLVGIGLGPHIGLAWDRFFEVFKEHWRFSSWLVGTALLQFFGSNFFLVAAGAIMGSGGVGALRIAQNLMGLTHVLFQAMENSVPIKAATALSRDGFSGMVKYLKIISLKSGVIVGLILCSVALVAEPLLSMVYGAEYIEYAYLLMGYCLFYAVLFPGYPLRYALRSMEYTQPIFVAYVISTIFSLSAAYPMVERWGLMGVVYGLITTQVLMQLCYVWMLRRKINV